MNKRVVIFLGNSERSLLPFLRSIENEFYNIVVGFGVNRVLKKSRYLDSYYNLKSTNSSSARAICNELLSIIRKYNDPIVIPNTDDFLAIVEENFEQFEAHATLTYNSKDSISNAINKFNLIKECEKLKFNIPKYRYIANIRQAEEIDLEFPVIIKPERSVVIKNDELCYTHVRLVNTYEEFIDECRFQIYICGLIVQEYIPGKGRGVNVFANNGNLVSSFFYNRLHEPGFGGGSSLRKSLNIDQALTNLNSELVEKLGINGIAMIEYRTCSSTKINYLMEINLRMWGSISLPISCGVDFPKLLLYQAIGKEYDHILTDYKVSMYSRNILKDIKWIFVETVNKLKKGKVRDAFYIVISNLMLFVKNRVTNNEVYDIFSLNNIGPFIQQIYLLFEKLLIKSINLITVFIFSLILLVRRRYESTSAVEKIKDGLSVSFVCRGNIIRSVFAEHLYNKQTGNNKASSYSTLSYNFRSPPLNAIKASKNYNVSIENHRSKFFTHKKDTVYFVMDVNQYLFLKRKSVNNVYLLSTFDRFFKPLKIDDPYKKDYIIYLDVYERINKIIDIIIKRANDEF